METEFFFPDPAFGIYAIRGYHGCFHLLVDNARHEAVLIDAGLVGEMSQLKHVLKEHAMDWSGIRAILLTHGHLDHTGNLARLKELTSAPILAHPLEQPHIDGHYPYTGAARLCGLMEATGRHAFHYRGATIDQFLTPEMELPYWGGLRVLHLPGHAEGHCAFYSDRFDLLFSGDLFASYWFSVHLPPSFLNSCPEKFPVSLQRVRELNPRRVIPNHYDRLDSELHRRRLQCLIQ